MTNDAVRELRAEDEPVTRPAVHADGHPAAGRRTVLKSAGLSAAGLSAMALLAACGGNNDSGGAASPGGSSSSAPSSDDGDGDKDGDESQSAGGAAGDFTVAASSVPVGGGFIDTKAKVVVTQPTAGAYKGFSAVCPHRGCTVGKVADGVISCPCHGSEFSATDGSVKQGPANSPLSSVSVKKSGTNIVKG